LKKFYYSNGIVTTAPESPLGVIAILQEDEQGRWIITSGGDFYIRRDDVWFEVDIFGLIDFCRDMGFALEGTKVSNTKYNEIMARAMKDREDIQDG